MQVHMVVYALQHEQLHSSYPLLLCLASGQDEGPEEYQVPVSGRELRGTNSEEPQHKAIHDGGLRTAGCTIQKAGSICVTNYSKCWLGKRIRIHSKLTQLLHSPLSTFAHPLT